ncbi:IclR family transcriptional regulator [Actinomycetospora cinnamomea]|uniref:IclR family transcriptional regulator n=1 Tax=Actinomycetospora cinnamomea TaxID=663609 RepID=A0A2U1FBV7_9PSEU|nr:IclR family transcriptional regulator [Actinomycetospora cinnamomea]PVZ09646.1 IclR family transcriptional regulator [Actinomycetospora cinnamomea]
MSPRARTGAPDAPSPRSPEPGAPVDGSVGAPSPRGRRSRDEAGGPVHRALDVLDLLGAPGGPSSLGVVEIARQLGRDKSQVSRLLKLLADAGYVDREPGSLRYRIGTRLFAIGATAVDRRLRDEADAAVSREAALLGERVDVGIRSGGSVMTISTAAPDSELRASGWVGRTAPLSCTATGRALLFDLDTAAIARVIVPEGLGPAGPAAPRSLDELVSRVADERRRGWSAARHETDRGLLSLAAPVRDSGGSVVAALGVSGPESRIDPVIDEVRAAVLRAAADLSRALGAEVSGGRAATAARAGPPAAHHDGVSPLPPPPAPERGAS